jgi:hypothetical protein
MKLIYSLTQTVQRRTVGWTSGGSIPSRKKIFLLTTESRPVVPGVMRPGREADRLPPSYAEVKDGAAIVPLPHIV